MTKCQVFISFDKEDCIYYLNEEVSGKVVLDVFETMTLRGLDIDYGWRTHGKGDQDKGELETQILLSEAT